MKNKSEVPYLFSCFKNQVENLLSTKIKILRTDDGTEYLPITKQFSQIIHQTTCPYTPEQNGLAERKHRHIIELALAIMSHASLPSTFWDEIFSSVIYLINRLPSQSNSIPYTKLLNKNLDYSLFRVLGCQCFPYTRPYNSNKLEMHALPCLFLGYATNQKGYCCLHLPTNKIYISRLVQFDEDFFPFKNLPLSASTASAETSPNPSKIIPLFTAQPSTSLLGPTPTTTINSQPNTTSQSNSPSHSFRPVNTQMGCLFNSPHLPSQLPNQLTALHTLLDQITQLLQPTTPIYPTAAKTSPLQLSDLLQPHPLFL